MKKLIIVSSESDGHSEANAFIATTKRAADDFIRSLLYFEDQLLFTFIREDKEDNNITTFFYEGDTGALSIKIVCFDKYKDVENMTIETFTG